MYRYSLAVTYLTEIAPIRQRTLAVLSVKMFWAAGGIFETALGYFVLPGLGYKYQVIILNCSEGEHSVRRLK